MKKHAIIPVFISHRGCPNDCVFCNQKKITAREGDVTCDDVRKTIKTYYQSFSINRPETVELAFFGGSFTGIPVEEQNAFLSLAKEYKDKGLIDKIHMSTRPDYIDRNILDNLKKYSVDVIELGVQSLDEDVLKKSGRGHDASCVYESSRLIKEYGFTLGIQLMIGLPGDTREKCIYSAEETVKIGPDIARLYPTVVIEDTHLFKMVQDGTYSPLAEDEAVETTATMYEILTNAGINVIRVGLKSSDLINDSEGSKNMAGTFHPAFRQLVEGRICRRKMEELLSGAGIFPAEKPGSTSCGTNSKRDVTFLACSRSIGNLAGHKGINRLYFRDKYPDINIHCRISPALLPGEYRLKL